MQRQNEVAYPFLPLPRSKGLSTFSIQPNGKNGIVVGLNRVNPAVTDTDLNQEPARVTLEPHENGIFDVKWNADDTLLATASGDKSTRISSVETQQLLSILDGHTSTVKCVAWDPAHRDLLTTGGRDGMLCLYDMRVNNMSDEDEIAARSAVITITAAHGQEKVSGGRRKVRPLPRGVTNILYPDDRPHGLVSSGSFDG
jgi:denticleless